MGYLQYSFGSNNNKTDTNITIKINRKLFYALKFQNVSAPVTLLSAHSFVMSEVPPKPVELVANFSDTIKNVVDTTVAVVVKTAEVTKEVVDTTAAFLAGIGTDGDFKDIGYRGERWHIMQRAQSPNVDTRQRRPMYL